MNNITDNNYNKIESNKILTIPNLFSFLRIILIIIAGCQLYNHNNINAFIIYLTAIITDFFDGLQENLIR